MEKPITLNIAVYDIEHNTASHYDQRHLGFAGHKHRENETALKIVEFKKEEKHYIGNGIANRRAAPQIQYHKEYGAFHQHPSNLVGNRRTPFIGNHLSVACINKQKSIKACHKRLFFTTTSILCKFTQKKTKKQIYSKKHKKTGTKCIYIQSRSVNANHIYLAVNVVTFVEDVTTGSAIKPLLSVPLTDEEYDSVYDVFFDISEELASTIPE